MRGRIAANGRRTWHWRKGGQRLLQPQLMQERQRVTRQRYSLALCLQSANPRQGVSFSTHRCMRMHGSAPTARYTSNNPMRVASLRGSDLSVSRKEEDIDTAKAAKAWQPWTRNTEREAADIPLRTTSNKENSQYGITAESQRNPVTRTDSSSCRKLE